MDWSTILLLILPLCLICSLFGYLPDRLSANEYTQDLINDPNELSDIPFGIENDGELGTVCYQQIGGEIGVDQIGGRGGRGGRGSGGRGFGGRGFSGNRGFSGRGFSGNRGFSGRGWNNRGWNNRGWNRGWNNRGWNSGWNNRGWGWNNWNNGWGVGWPYYSSAWWPTTTIVGTSSCANLAANQCLNSLDFTTCYNSVYNNCAVPNFIA